MSYLQCPECRLTVAVSVFYLRGDQCPRCMTTMEERSSLRPEPQAPLPAFAPHAGTPADRDAASA